MNWSVMIAAVALLVFGGMVSTVPAQRLQSAPNAKQTATANAFKKTLVGAWRTVVTARNCQTGDPVASLPGLFTFHTLGTMSEFGVPPGSSPALRSPGHGVWRREHSWQDHSFAFIHYRYNASGIFIGSQKVTATLELGASGDEFTATSSIEILDANDIVIATACATSAGTRFE